MIEGRELDKIMLNALIVDDEVVICEGMKLIIDWEKHGFNVPDTSENAYMALSKLNKKRYDLIVTDIRMPGIDGLELIKELNSNGTEHNVVIMSGYKDFEYALTAIRFGVLRYLLKPINEDELINTLLYIKEKKLKHFRTFSKAATLQENSEVIYSHILQLNYDAVEADIGMLINCIVESEMPIGACAGIIIAIVKEILDKMSKIGLNSLDIFWKGYSIEDYLYASDADILKKRFKSICLKLMGFIERKQNKNTQSDIKEIKQYIEENFNSPISIKSIASLFYFNPAYLGRKYKESTGENINDYVNICRIERAKELLTDKDFNLSSIYMEVGYSNSDLYYKHFKKITGMNPTQYKNLFLEDANHNNYHN